MASHPSTLLQLACSAARVGGKLARDAFGTRIRVSIKPDASEVTEVDVAAERAIVDHILIRRPADTFIGEEGVAARLTHSSTSNPSDISWAIDPIDGTRNFIRGVPLFACSVAALRDGMPIAAAIYDPMADSLFAAARGGGATINGAAIPRMAPEAPGAGGRGSAPIVAIPSAWRNESGPFVRTLLERCVVRCLGCATLQLVHVAIGGIDATFMNNCKIWDIAAGALIVDECGGASLTPAGLERFPADEPAMQGAETPILSGAPWAVSMLTRWRSERADL